MYVQLGYLMFRCVGPQEQRDEEWTRQRQAEEKAELKKKLELKKQKRLAKQKQKHRNEQ